MPNFKVTILFNVK